MKLIQLQSGHLLSEGGKISDSGTELEKDVLLVYTGKFSSMDGEVEIKDEDIDKLAENHNKVLSKLKRLADGGVPAKHSPPIQLDHSTSAKDTVGRLIGEVKAAPYTDEDGTEKKGLYGKIKFLGRENVEKVNDGRWTHVSIGADLKAHKISELTITPFPAAANASLLSKGDDDMGYKDMKEKMAKYAKAKKHLTEKMKMSEEDAEKKLAEAPEEDVHKMAAEQDEDDKKMAADDVKKDEEKKAEMAAKKEKLAQLSTDFRSAGQTAKLAAKVASMSVRLAKLKAEAKITPAEIKKIDLAKLAAKSEEAIEGFFESMELRETVIPVGQYGTLKAETPAQLATRLKHRETKDLEAETRANMSLLSKPVEGAARLASEAEVKMGDVVPQPGEEGQRQMSTEEHVAMEKSYETMKALMDQGMHDEAKEHFKKCMTMKQMASPAEEHMSSEAEEKMSSLSNEMKKMHTAFNEYEKLVAPLVGLSN